MWVRVDVLTPCLCYRALSFQSGRRLDGYPLASPLIVLLCATAVDGLSDAGLAAALTAGLGKPLSAAAQCSMRHSWAGAGDWRFRLAARLRFWSIAVLISAPSLAAGRGCIVDGRGAGVGPPFRHGAAGVGLSAAISGDRRAGGGKRRLIGDKVNRGQTPISLASRLIGG